MKLTSQDLADLSVGAALLGTGGGGNPYLGLRMAQLCLDEGLEIDVIDPEDLAEDALVIPTAMIGAPTVLVEKIPSGEEALNAFWRMEKLLGRKADATMPIEVGGINSMIPLVVGARAGVPIVNADGMGRAFPEMQMETFGVYGVKACPAILCNEWGDTSIFHSDDNAFAEWMARGVCIRMGGAAYMSLFPMSGADVRRTGIPRTMTLAISIGKLLREAHTNNENPFDKLIAYFPDTLYKRGEVIFRGKIGDLVRETKMGFSMGRLQLEGLDAWTGDKMEIEIQNENLVARLDGKVRAIVPDLICIMDTETATPITTEALRYGQRVTVLHISVPPIMRTPEALEVFGPAAFGLTEPYTPHPEVLA